MTCDFESGEDACGFLQKKQDDFDWTWQTGMTDSVDTGPSGGEGGSDYYMYIEASKPRVPGDVAR